MSITLPYGSRPQSTTVCTQDFGSESETEENLIIIHDVIRPRQLDCFRPGMSTDLVQICCRFQPCQLLANDSSRDLVARVLFRFGSGYIKLWQPKATVQDSGHAQQLCLDLFCCLKWNWMRSTTTVMANPKRARFTWIHWTGRFCWMLSKHQWLNPNPRDLIH